MKRRVGFAIAGLSVATLAGGIALAGEPASLDSLGSIVRELGGKGAVSDTSYKRLEPAIAPVPHVAPAPAKAPEATAACQKAVATSTLMRLEMTRKVAERLVESSTVFDRNVVDVLAIEAEALRNVVKTMSREAAMENWKHGRAEAIAAVSERLARIEEMRAVNIELRALYDEAIAMRDVESAKAEADFEE
ncbi:hypothetical protein [Pseudokordiimonas caeni]|uniref:hypothetical protein n=1 Tax=Pseudokordiimonas caeni TaxID=2997908 RepID=UPI00281276C8|nr:hypothetical protein [Pseudokordiimonas caeni]